MQACKLVTKMASESYLLHVTCMPFCIHTLVDFERFVNLLYI